MTTINCPNYKICKKVGTIELFSCFNNKCLNCDVILGEWKGGDGVLKYITATFCCICLENNIESVKMPTCDHSVCVEDFKKLYNNARVTYEDEGKDEVVPLRCPLCRSE